MQSKAKCFACFNATLFLQLASNTPYITKRTGLLAPQTAKELKKEGTETEKRKILEEINKVKAENIPLCKIVSEGAAKIRKLKINQKKVFKTC